MSALIVTSPTTGDEWEVVIGLEVHAELATATKIFCGAPNQFGDEPNTNIGPVCLGLPGSLPVLNEAAVELAIRVGPGAALHGPAGRSSPGRTTSTRTCRRTTRSASTTSRLNVDGWLELPDGTRVGIERAHLEEDTGKSTHQRRRRPHPRRRVLARRLQPRRRAAGRDRRRARPPHRPRRPRPTSTSCAPSSWPSARRDGKMEEGSMRVDANVSVRPRRRRPSSGTRCEIKNVNSLRSLGRAIEYEARRQIDLLEAGERVAPGDPPLGRGGRAHPRRSLQGGGRGLPLLPRARPRAARPDGRVDRGDRRRAAAAAGRAPGPAGRGGRRRAGRRGHRTCDRGLDDLALGGHRAPAPTRPACSPTSSTTWRSTAPSRSTPPHFAALVAPRGRRRAHRHPGQDGAGRDGRAPAGARGDRQGARLRGDGQPATSRPSSTASSPPTPTTGPSSWPATTRARSRSSPASSPARS